MPVICVDENHLNCNIREDQKIGKHNKKKKEIVKISEEIAESHQQIKIDLINKIN